MKKRIQKMIKNEKGLTLVELLAVIVILGIIAAIAIPSIGNIIENSRINAMKADALNALSASDLYFLEVDLGETNNTKVKISELSEYLDDQGSLTNDTEITYNTDGNTISGNAKNGKNTLIFLEATKSSINEAKPKSGNTISGTGVTE